MLDYLKALPEDYSQRYVKKIDIIYRLELHALGNSRSCSELGFSQYKIRMYRGLVNVLKGD